VVLFAALNGPLSLLCLFNSLLIIIRAMKEESFMNEESVNERCFEERWWEKQQTFLGCPDLPLIMTVTFTLHQYNRCR
jgi:hypothetical protein